MKNHVIKLGNEKNPKNHIKIKDDSVSFNHLEIIWIDNRKILFKDLGSTNGTYVNDRKIKSCEVGLNDSIKIGFNNFTGKEIFDKCILIRNKDKIVFYKEFKELEQLFNQYYSNVKKIKTSYKTKVTIIRIAIPAILLFIFHVYGDFLGIPKDYRLIIPLFGGGFASIFAEKLFNQEDLRLKQQQLKEIYQKKLVCPKCRHILINKSYQFWKSERKCPKCQANWVG